MRRLVYSMTMSLDGFIAGPAGDIGWSAPDEELHRFHNDRVREVGVQLCGRRLYEEMTYWEKPESAFPGSIERDFARIWKALPKVVFSTTLSSVIGNARLATAPPAEEVARLKASEEGGAGDIAVGGAGLAASVLDLVDEFQVFVAPVVLGGGTPFFPARDGALQLDLLETRTFGSRVVYLRYARRRDA